MKRIKPLMECIPAFSPGFRAPTHLAPVVELFERIGRGEEVHACVFAPPRHLKTSTILAGCIWLLRQRPTTRIGWATYSDRLTSRTGRNGLLMAKRVRVPLDPTAQSKTDWLTGHGEGGFFGTSIGGASIGMGFNLKVVDDAVANRIDAESPLVRERTFEWFTDTWGSRGEPGCSDIVAMHRWHSDDLGGRLEAAGWEVVSLPVLDAAGRPLDPMRFDAAALEKRRELVGEYSWWSLWMQQPRGRGQNVFSDVNTFDELPAHLTIAIGIDLAYSARSSADYSVAVVLGTDGSCFYVLRVVRMQVTAPVYRAHLEELRAAYPGAPLVSYIGGQERAVLDLFAEDGLHIDGTPAHADKFIRAQPASAAWNARKILLPASVDALREPGAPSSEEDRKRKPQWLAPFVDEIVSFTGTRDRNDDQVDALVAAFDSASAIARSGDGDGPRVVYGSGTRWGDDVRGY